MMSLKRHRQKIQEWTAKVEAIFLEVERLTKKRKKTDEDLKNLAAHKKKLKDAHGWLQALKGPRGRHLG